MNSYERVMTVFQHQEPDRIPLIEMSVSDQIVKAFGCQDLYEFQSKYYDGITVRNGVSRINIPKTPPGIHTTIQSSVLMISKNWWSQPPMIPIVTIT